MWKLRHFLFIMMRINGSRYYERIQKDISMKKVLTFCLTVFFLLNSVFSQKNYDVTESLQCSKAKFYKSYFLRSKEIIQTPLLFDYDVKFYFLDLNVSSNSVDISGNVTINAESVVTALDTFAVELIDDMIIDSVKINGTVHGFTHTGNEVFIPLQNSVLQGEMLSSQIFYHGTPPTGEFFSGVSSEYDENWNQNVTWTLSEPFSAREWFPVKQVLTDKADSAWIFLTFSDTLKAGSEGLLTAITPMPGNKVRYEWKTRYPIDYYLLSFAVADYEEYDIYAKPAEMNGDSILIQNYIYDTDGCLEYYKPNIDNTAGFIELFSDFYSLYPFHEEKYGHCITALGGGMEHQTMTTLGGFGFGIVAHELGHMWFGDNVTCKTWNDIWINEGFATYSDYLAHEFIAAPQWHKIWMQQTMDHVLSEPGGSVYVPDDAIEYDSVWRIFDARLSYYKGAILLHMIRFELNDDELFFSVMKNFQQQYAGGVATGLDFMNVLNETTGIDFTYFFDQWYFGQGYPVYDIEWAQWDGNFVMTATQSSSMPDITPFFKMTMEYGIYFNDGTDTLIRVWQTGSVENYIIPVNKQIDSIAVDPHNWCLKKVASISMGTEDIYNPVFFTITPNPASDVLFVHFADDNNSNISVTIYDLSGKAVINTTLTKENNRIDISELKPSAYLISVEGNGARMVKKFIMGR